MTNLYFQFLRFIANQEAKRQIAKLIKQHETKFVKFRYSDGYLSTKVKLVDASSSVMNEIEDSTEDLITGIQRINAEKQNTLDQLYRERHGTEDAL